MVKNPSAKIKGRLSFRTFLSKTKSKPRKRYLVFKLPDGSFHAFVEVEALEAAIDCGANAKKSRDTRVLWKEVWNR